MNTTLVIMAAGLGSRFGGNKQISHVGPHGEMLMEYSICDAIRAGFGQIVFILKQDMVDLIRSTVGARIPSHIRVDYAVQDASTLPTWYSVPSERVKPFGTVHALLCARDVIRGPFATVNADDYYGREAFSVMHRMLCDLGNEKNACMVPYILGNTMSENGGVTRGICQIDGGQLQRITETHDIRYENGGIVGEFGSLSGEEQVSMNIWGFHPSIFDRMSDYFEAFLRGLSPDEIKAECLLPVMVSDFLGTEIDKVRAIPSHEKWFGLTYQADREIVVGELSRLHDAGVYGEQLF